MTNFKKNILSCFTALLFLAGCGDSDSTTTMDSNNTNSATNDNNTTEMENTRFTTRTIDTETLEVDNIKKVEWIGSNGKNMNACQPNAAATTEVADIVGAEAHCTELVFGAYNDWRVATSVEHKEHIIAMNTAGKTPYYLNPSCPRVIGVENAAATAVNTHNSTPVGATTTWSDLISGTTSNYGVKCVRDIPIDGGGIAQK